MERKITMIVAPQSQVRAYLQLMRLDRPIGSLLLLWPTLWALWLAAEGIPRVSVLLVFVGGVFVMRSAGCVINDFADRHVDGHVTRTQGRPLVSGRIRPIEALVLFGILVGLALALVLTQNNLTIELAFGALFFAAIYPFMKRVTHLPQLFLGLAFSWAIPMAFAAQSGSIPPIAWLLVIANSFWTIAYDTFYAMVDRDDDLKIGIKSTAILFGRRDKLIVGILQLATLLVLASIGCLQELGAVYYVGLTVAGGLFVYQQRLASRRERDGCFAAFLNNNYVGACIFVGIAAHYLF
jgi:4-hydroxybenzoate polyprenyltransferase